MSSSPTTPGIEWEIARSIVDSEISKINDINLQRFPKFICNSLQELGRKLKDKSEEVIDRPDLIELKSQINFVSQLIDLFLEASPSRSSWWAMPLIKECYDRCGIDYINRHIIIIHSISSQNYGVCGDVLGFLPDDLKSSVETDQPVDVFIIPSEAKHDIASIALIGHEAGHVYWKIKYDLLVKTLNEQFDKTYGGAPTSSSGNLADKRKRMASHIQEFLCDAIGRLMMGPAFDFALLKHFYSSPEDQNTSSKTHPPELSRIHQSYNSLKNFHSANTAVSECLATLVDQFAGFEAELKSFTKNADDSFSEQLAESIHAATGLTSPYNDQYLSNLWGSVVAELNAFRPPFESVNSEVPVLIPPTQAVVATSLYYYARFFVNQNEYYLHTKVEEKQRFEVLRKRLCEHLRYAISLYDFVRNSQGKFCGNSLDVKELNSSLWPMRQRESDGKANPFVVTPSTNPKSQYSSNSVDLRLGTSFLLNKTSGYTHISPEPELNQVTGRDIPLEAFYQELFVPVGDNFILHPHQFVLAATLEYICVPFDYYALVLGRSSWGRLGLNIATATTVHAGFRGCITLELRNLGETPLPLKVGLRIAQLCLIPVPAARAADGHVGYFATLSKYIGPVAPKIPKIKDDEDWALLNSLNQ
jgi:dCTP deaminase